MAEKTVKIGMGHKANLGNYESLHFDIEIQDEVRDGETVKAATERVYQFVSDRLAKEIEKMDKLKDR